MKITLAKVHYSASLSEETNAYSAVVVIDGVPAFHASNHGQGSLDDFHPLKAEEGAYQKMREAIERIDAYAKALPTFDCFGKQMHHDAEMLISRALDSWLLERDLKRALKTKVLFVKDGSIFQFKKTQNEAQSRLRCIAQGHKCFLNDLPFDEALAIYQQVLEKKLAA